MKALTKTVASMLLVFALVSTVQATEPFPCRFDSYFAGDLKSVTQVAEGYIIELEAGVESMKHLIRKGSPEYYTTIQFIQKAQKATMPPEGAFLLNNNTSCGFTPFYRDDIVVNSHRRDGDRYVFSVHTNTNLKNSYTLYISYRNPLFSNAESVISKMSSGPLRVEFNSSYELMAAYRLDDAMLSRKPVRPNNFGERFGDRARTDNEEWRDPRFGLEFKPRFPIR